MTYRDLIERDSGTKLYFFIKYGNQKNLFKNLFGRKIKYRNQHKFVEGF